MTKYMSKISRNVIFPESKKQRKTTRGGWGGWGIGGVGWGIGGGNSPLFSHYLLTICPLFLKFVIVKTEKNSPSLGF